MENDIVNWYKSSDDFEMCRLSAMIEVGKLHQQYRLTSGKICDLVIFSERNITIIELKNKPIQPKDLLQLYGYIEEIRRIEFLHGQKTGFIRNVRGVLVGTEIGCGFDRVYRTLVANLHDQLDVMKIIKDGEYLTTDCIYYNYIFKRHGN